MFQKVKNINMQLLSDDFKPLQKVEFDQLMKDDKWHHQTKEVYNNGDAAAILLYNKSKHTVILTRQFRMPTYLNKNEDGMLTEVCAGKLDNDTPEVCILREVREETGYDIPEVHKIFEGYSSPASLTEKIYCFIGAYDASMKMSEGGGLKEEGEEIQVCEMSFEEAFSLIYQGKIQDLKTLLLLQYLKSNELH